MAAAATWPNRDRVRRTRATLAPILDAYEEAGVDLCYEIHPGEDVFDGARFEMFFERSGNRKRCKINYDPSHFLLQQLDYLAFIDIYPERISAFHVKDAEFNPTAVRASIPASSPGSTARRVPLAWRRAGRLEGSSRGWPNRI